VSFNNILFDVGFSLLKFVGCKMKLTSDVFSYLFAQKRAGFRHPVDYVYVTL